jgi:hypothetical protein
MLLLYEMFFQCSHFVINIFLSSSKCYEFKKVTVFQLTATLDTMPQPVVQKTMALYWHLLYMQPSCKVLAQEPDRISSATTDRQLFTDKVNNAIPTKTQVPLKCFRVTFLLQTLLPIICICY